MNADGNPNSAPGHLPHVEGWGQIAQRIADRAGIRVSIDCVTRWARRKDDPLPVKRWGRGRPRVFASAVELDAWVERQFQDEANEGRSAPALRRAIDERRQDLDRREED